jgi:hypothetical protein
MGEDLTVDATFDVTGTDLFGGAEFTFDATSPSSFSTDYGVDLTDGSTSVVEGNLITNTFTDTALNDTAAISTTPESFTAAAEPAPGPDSTFSLSSQLLDLFQPADASFDIVPKDGNGVVALAVAAPISNDIPVGNDITAQTNGAASDITLTPQESGFAATAIDRALQGVPDYNADGLLNLTDTSTSTSTGAGDITAQTLANGVTASASDAERALAEKVAAADATSVYGGQGLSDVNAVLMSSSTPRDADGGILVAGKDPLRAFTDSNYGKDIAPLNIDTRQQVGSGSSKKSTQPDSGVTPQSGLDAVNKVNNGGTIENAGQGLSTQEKKTLQENTNNSLLWNDKVITNDGKAQLNALLGLDKKEANADPIRFDYGKYGNDLKAVNTAFGRTLADDATKAAFNEAYSAAMPVSIDVQKQRSNTAQQSAPVSDELGYSELKPSGIGAAANGFATKVQEGNEVSKLTDPTGLFRWGAATVISGVGDVLNSAENALTGAANGGVTVESGVVSIAKSPLTVLDTANTIFGNNPDVKRTLNNAGQALSESLNPNASDAETLFTTGASKLGGDWLINKGTTKTFETVSPLVGSAFNKVLKSTDDVGTSTVGSNTFGATHYSTAAMPGGDDAFRTTSWGEMTTVRGKGPGEATGTGASGGSGAIQDLTEALRGRTTGAAPGTVAKNFEDWFGSGSPKPQEGYTRTAAERTMMPDGSSAPPIFERFVATEGVQPYARASPSDSSVSPSHYVADANGAPISVYHGSGAQFETFAKADPDNMFGKGYYFTSEQPVAVDYAKKAVETAPNSGAQPVVYDVALSLKKPYVITTPQLNVLWNSGVTTKAEIVNSIKKQGFDGLVFENPYGQKTYMIFEPTQIKSLKNTGQFDPKNPNIHSLTTELMLDETA